MIGEGVVFQDVSFTYRNGNVGVEGLTFSALPGRVLGLLGPNGAGKSTTIHLMTTSLQAATGRVIVAGLDLPSNMRAVRRLVSLCPQEYALDPILTVTYNLRIVGLARGVRGVQLKESVERVLSLFGLSDKRDAITMHLSGGQARRLQLARALLFPASVLVVDEPTLGIDPAGLAIARDLISQAARSGSVVIVATNDMDQAAELCDDILFIAKGRRLAMGTTNEFIREYGGQEIVRLSSQQPIPFDQLSSALGCQIERVTDSTASILTDNAPETLARLVNLDLVKELRLSRVEIARPTLKDAFLRLSSQQGGDPA